MSRCSTINQTGYSGCNMKPQLLAFALLFSGIVFAQPVPRTDSILKPMEFYFHEKSWGFRFATGIQSSFFLEAGLGRSELQGTGHGIGGYDYFLSVIYFPDFSDRHNTVTGIKTGAHLFGNGFLLGAEIAYIADKQQHTDLLITPKAGIGVSYLYASYGYAFSTNSYAVSRVGKHQFTLQYNLPFYTHEKLSGKRRKWF